MATSRIISRSQPIALGTADLRSRIGTWTCPAMLGGGGLLGQAGRWSILAARPRQIFESASGQGFQVWIDQTPTSSNGDALAGLGLLLEEHGLAGDAHDLDTRLPFQGGLIGFLSYDLAPRIEKIPRRNAADSRIPALRFGLYDTFLLIDHERDQANLWAVDLLREGERAVNARLEDWLGSLDRPISRTAFDPNLGPVVADQPKADYLTRVHRAKEYIRAGDIFQVNLSQRFSASGLVDPLDLDSRLQANSPAPYSAYLRWDDLAIVSVSPELFYETTGRRITTRPIKGTRPRSSSKKLDEAMAAELIASTKDQAELTMIVDLERNDLGRVCEYGSVQVANPRSLESFQNVHHTTATVEGRLRADACPVDVVRAMFPGGSITGAPKVRAMEIIDELEPCRRGIYTGAIGYWSANGRSAFNIAIRTVVVEGTRVTYHVGGGIVADSDPEQEYQETLDKGRTLFGTLNSLGLEP